MRFLVVALVIVPLTARAEALDLAIGGGIAMANAPARAVRLSATADVSNTRNDGMIYGATCGYDFWHGADGAGFHIPIVGFGGVRAGSITSTVGLGIGVLAIETWHGQDGFGIVPMAMSTVGFALDAAHSVAIDARLQRHVLADSQDFTTWSVLLMIGWGACKSVVVGHQRAGKGRGLLPPCRRSPFHDNMSFCCRSSRRACSRAAR
jgi:hypothetical protein